MLSFSSDGLLRWLKQGAFWLALFLAVLAVGGFLFAWSGIYSVAASRGHWPGFRVILEFGMRSSVRTHALAIAVPDLTAPALIERGAGHFQGACAPCHGAPGRARNLITLTMLPEPPDLAASVPTWQPNELFWIVKHGLKYTGMPAWTAAGRDDEVWAVVAFLQRLPQIEETEYRELAGLKGSSADIPNRILAQGGPLGRGIAACSRCHGLDGKGRGNGAFPRLDIQSTEYLAAQLDSYVKGTRQSGIMQPVAAELATEERGQLAAYYSGQLQQAAASIQAPSVSLGRRIAEEGLPELAIPACFSCHAQDAAQRNSLYPALAGQYAVYASEQLALFKSGKRRGTPEAEIMTVIAKRLSDDHIAEVSNFLAGLSAP